MFRHCNIAKEGQSFTKWREPSKVQTSNNSTQRSEKSLQFFFCDTKQNSADPLSLFKHDSFSSMQDLVSTIHGYTFYFWIDSTRFSFKTCSLCNYHFISVLHKTHGLNLITGPNKTIVAYAGSNETFTWKLKLSAEDKSKELKAQFGPWDKQHSLVYRYLITFIRNSSGKKTEIKPDDPMAQRLFWVGDLARNDYVAFQLNNVQKQDKGTYGIRFRVDYFPPDELETWFSLKIEVKICFYYNISFRNLACRSVNNEKNRILLHRKLPFKFKLTTERLVLRSL